MAPKAVVQNPSWDEMEAKRQQMVKSLQSLSEAMKHCVYTIEDYVSHSPENIADTNAKKREAEGQLTKSGKLKKQKKIKDPNEPKRPPNAYLAYQMAVKEELSKKHPDLPYKEIVTQIAEMWKGLSPAEKEPYETRYQALNGEYKTRLETYKGDKSAAEAKIAEDSEDSEEDTPVPQSTSKVAPLETASTVAGSDSESDDEEKTDDSDSEEEAAPVPAPPAKKSKKTATPAPAPPTPTQTKAAPKSKKADAEKKEKKTKAAAAPASSPVEKPKKAAKTKKTA